jgi:hypothetical protein
MNYGAAGSATDKINRVTGITWMGSGGTGVVMPVVEYDYTGAGRKRKQTFGSDNITLDLNPTTPNDYRTDRFGRVTRMAYESGSSVFEDHSYAYDANGNRQFTRVSHKKLYESGQEDNVRSWIYRYDPLNRLIASAFGQIDDASPASTKTFQANTTRHGRDWKLDILGNWSGDTADPPVSVRDYASQTITTEFHSTNDAVPLYEQHHVINEDFGVYEAITANSGVRRRRQATARLCRFGHHRSCGDH